MYPCRASVNRDGGSEVAQRRGITVRSSGSCERTVVGVCVCNPKLRRVPIVTRHGGPRETTCYLKLHLVKESISYHYPQRKIKIELNYVLPRSLLLFNSIVFKIGYGDKAMCAW